MAPGTSSDGAACEKTDASKRLYAAIQSQVSAPPSRALSVSNIPNMQGISLGESFPCLSELGRVVTTETSVFGSAPPG
jgi:hypothetical protein